MECTVRSLRRELAARGIALLTSESISELGTSEGAYVSLTDDGTDYVVARAREESFSETDGPVVGIDTTLCERLGVEPGDHRPGRSPPSPRRSNSPRSSSTPPSRTSPPTSVPTPTSS